MAVCRVCAGCARAVSAWNIRIPRRRRIHSTYSLASELHFKRTVIFLSPRNGALFEMTHAPSFCADGPSEGIFRRTDPAPA